MQCCQRSAFARNTEDRSNRVRNRVGNRFSGEHEPVVWIAHCGHQAQFQSAQHRLFIAAFQTANPLVEQRHQINDPVWHRGIGRKNGLFCLTSRKPEFTPVLFLGFGNQFAENFDFFRDWRPATENDFGELFQSHQPERQIQRVNIDGNGMIRKCRRKFIMGIKDQDTQLRIGSYGVMEQ